MSSAIEKVTQNLIAVLESGENLPWKKPWSMPLPSNISGRRYSGINRFILGCSEYRHPTWVTFNQAKQMGGTVKKGEKGTQVLLFKPLLSLKEDENTVQKSLFSQTFTVFNIFQTECIDIPEVQMNRVENSEIISILDQTLQSFESCPPIKFGGDRAYYSPIEDYVQMPNQLNFETEAAYASVLAHEISHSTGHPLRLNRFNPENPNPRDGLKYCFEELVAEISASFVLAELGIIGHESQNAAYVQSWIKGFKEQRYFLLAACSRAEKSAAMILGRSLR
jgi:antirestriction protein ArdC